MTTKEAFEQMISARAIHHQLGLKSYTVRDYRNDIKQFKKYPSTDKMESLLIKTGWKVIQEKKWKSPGGILTKLGFIKPDEP